ncbi:MAG: TlpA disulfide reductase family protein [Dysgonomonas sp.]|nr:TlpA disulfide reductase family protein [Dysgonomonas sp.]
MRNISFLFIFFLVQLSICSQTAYNIKGQVSDRLNGKVAMLLFKDVDSGGVIHIETDIIKNNGFNFNGQINTLNLLGAKYIDDIGIVALEKYPSSDLSTEIFLEEGTISVEFDTISHISGTPNNNLLQTYITLAAQSFSDAHVQFIKDNMDNFLSVKMFRSCYQQLSENDLNDILVTANESFREHEDVILCIKSREIIRSIEEKDKVRGQMLQTKCADYELMTSTGETKKLYDYIGKSKYLVIDFWASWCGPCIKGMPHMKMLSEKYKEKGVEFVGISLDTEDAKEYWLNAVKRIDVPWVQLSNLEGTGSKLAEDFAVSDVPYVVIVDAEGSILDYVRLPVVYLEAALEKLP